MIGVLASIHDELKLFSMSLNFEIVTPDSTLPGKKNYWIKKHRH